MLARDLGAKAGLSRMVYSGDNSKEKVLSDRDGFALIQARLCSLKEAHVVTFWIYPFLPTAVSQWVPIEAKGAFVVFTQGRPLFSVASGPRDGEAA
jgi:hypothetical protein